MTPALPRPRATVLPPMLTLDSATLYAVQGGVYALDSASGTVRGHFADHVLAPVAVGDAVGDALYANTSTHPTAALLALDPLTGVARWRYEITGRLFTVPVVAERAILLGASEGFVDAVDPRDGTLRWRHETGGILFAAPTVAADVAYCSPAPGGSERAAVLALGLDDGALLWRADLPSFTSHPLIVSSGTVYVGAHDACYALRAADGALAWQRPLPARMMSIHAPLAYADNALYAAYQQTEHMWEPPGMPSHRELAGVLALDAANGNERWLQPLGADTGATRAGALAVAAVAVYVGSDDGYVNALRVDDGALLWRTHLGDLSFGATVATPDALYLGASDGAVYALRPADGALLWRAFISTSITVAASLSLTAMRVSQPPPDPPNPSDPSGPSSAA